MPRDAPAKRTAPCSRDRKSVAPLKYEQVRLLRVAGKGEFISAMRFGAVDALKSRFCLLLIHGGGGEKGVQNLQGELLVMALFGLYITSPIRPGQYISDFAE